MHMDPWQSWAIVGVVGAGAYFYYTRSPRNQRAQIHSHPSSNQTPQHQASPAKDGSKGRRRKTKTLARGEQSDDTEGRSSSIPAKRKEKSNLKQNDRPSRLNPSASELKSSPRQLLSGQTKKHDDKEAELDNHEFAKQMAGVRTGASLAKKESQQAKSRKQDQQPYLGTPLPPSDMSRTSSTTGGEGDEDTASSAPSPEFNASKPAGDVSDMLEAPGKGPSVLRLTELPKEQGNKPKKQKVEQQVETKKQRQRRRQKEELKELRNETEKERRMKLENQLRTARNAEGRPAKNGTASAQSPVPSVWTNTANGTVIAAPSENVSLLDTFESNGVQHQKSSPGEGQASSASTSEKAWEQEYRSEEEQMRLLQELDGNGWSTVEKGGKPRKNKANGQAGSSSAASIAATDDGPHTTNSNANRPSNQENVEFTSSSQKKGDGTGKKRTTKETIDTRVWKYENIHSHPDYDPAHPYALLGHPDDSDWAVV